MYVWMVKQPIRLLRSKYTVINTQSPVKTEETDIRNMRNSPHFMIYISNNNNNKKLCLSAALARAQIYGTILICPRHKMYSVVHVYLLKLQNNNALLFPLCIFKLVSVVLWYIQWISPHRKPQRSCFYVAPDDSSGVSAVICYAAPLSCIAAQGDPANL